MTVGSKSTGAARAATHNHDSYTWRWIAVVLVTLGVGVGLLLRAVEERRPKGSDTDQLRAILSAAESSAERSSVGGISQLLSKDYRDEMGFNEDSARFALRDFFRSRPGLDINIPSRSIRPMIAADGEHASLDFDVQATFESQGGRVPLMTHVSLRLTREPVYYFLAFPGAEWKITSASGYLPLAE